MFSGFEVRNVFSISGMLDGCRSLRSLDLSNFRTSELRGYIDSMFRNCELLTSLDLSNLKLPRVNSIARMFEGCKNLENIIFSNSLDTSNLKDMSYLFYGYEKLKQLNLSRFSSSLVTSMEHMLDSCYSLTSIAFNYYYFDTSETKYFSYMFNNCTSLKTLDIHFNTKKAIDMSYMFSNCTLEEININTFNTSSVTNMRSMFESCTEMKILDLSSFNTKSFKVFTDMFAKTENMTVIVKYGSCDNMIAEIENVVNFEIIE